MPAPSTADIRAFETSLQRPTGNCILEFQPVKDTPFVNGIEITREIAGRMLPIRILAQEHPYTDRNGVVWEPIASSRVVSNVPRSEALTGTSDPDLFRGERFGNFSTPFPWRQESMP